MVYYIESECVEVSKELLSDIFCLSLDDPFVDELYQNLETYYYLKDDVDYQQVRDNDYQYTFKDNYLAKGMFIKGISKGITCISNKDTDYFKNNFKMCTGFITGFMKFYQDQMIKVWSKHRNRRYNMYRINYLIFFKKVKKVKKEDKLIYELFKRYIGNTK